MMNTGDWSQSRAFLDAMTAPLYIPQLGFRTAFAFMTGAVFLWFCTYFFTNKDAAARAWMVERLSHVVLSSMMVLFFFGIWYWFRIPESMRANQSVALLSMSFVQWHDKFAMLLGWTIAAFLLIAIGGLTVPRLIPRWALLIPTFMGIWLLGHFERAREFMRKPWVIAEYLYSNGIRKDELRFLQSEGMLKHATYVKHHTVTPENRVEAGEDVFMISCSRCHSTTGLNGVLEKFTLMYGPGEWSEGGMVAFLGTMHKTSTFMPPFPGNRAEKEALVAYILDLRKTREPLTGAQSDGIRLPHLTPASINP
jgi:hypothetical protein